MKHQFIISAPNSNAGKTTVTLGLLRLLKQKGLSVQPFKVGPDYIDPKFHKLASGKTGVNLDLFMMRKEELQESIALYGNNADVHCIEGVMGLFDGAKKDKGSTAHLAKEIKTPVVLIVDAKSVAYSVAPLIQGFTNFDKDVNIIGVIFNRVGSERHYTFLKEACEGIGVTSFGYVPKIPEADIPSRHLGLNIEDITQFDKAIDAIALEIDKTVDWQELLKRTVRKPLETNTKDKSSKKSGIQFLVAKDDAFNFTYKQTITAMETLGSVTFFSPLKDEELPKGDVLYLPGGYPESYLEALSTNTKMRNAIHNFAEQGGATIAECGGMMYLGKEIIDKEGKAFSMANVFEFSTTMQNMKLSLGYKSITLDTLALKGHEFHYSNTVNDERITYKGKIYNARGKEVATKIYQYKNTLASYIHLYLGDVDKLKELIATIKK